jgi:hypothetical protein
MRQIVAPKGGQCGAAPKILAIPMVQAYRFSFSAMGSPCELQIYAEANRKNKAHFSHRLPCPSRRLSHGRLPGRAVAGRWDQQSGEIMGVKLDVIARL